MSAGDTEFLVAYLPCRQQNCWLRVDGKMHITIRAVAIDLYMNYTISNAHSTPSDHEIIIVIYSVLIIIMPLWNICQNELSQRKINDEIKVVY